MTVFAHLRVSGSAILLGSLFWLPVLGQTGGGSPDTKDVQRFGAFRGDFGPMEIYIIGDAVRGESPDGFKLSATITGGNPWENWQGMPYPFEIKGTVTGPVNPAILADCPGLPKTVTTTFKGDFIEPWKIKGTFVQRRYHQDEDGKHECVPRDKYEQSFSLTKSDRWKDLLEGNLKDIKDRWEEAGDKADEIGDSIRNSREVNRPRDRYNDFFGETADDFHDAHHERN